MVGTTTKGGRVATEGVVVEAPTARVGTVALVSMVKFLRLLKMHPAEGRKKTSSIAANGSRNRNPKGVGWQVQN